MKNEEEYAIEVKDVYKTFDVYLDKANSLKEKMLFIRVRGRFPCRFFRKRKYLFQCINIWINKKGN